MSFPGRFITFPMDEVPLADQYASQRKSYIRGGGGGRGAYFLLENSAFPICS